MIEGLFAEAYNRVSRFTYPVIVSRRLVGGEIQCGLAAFVVLNSDGWIATAAHVLEPMRVHADHLQSIAGYEREVAAIDAGPGNDAGKAKRKRALTYDPSWIQNYSMWWGADDVSIVDVATVEPADLTIARLEPFHEEAWGGTYPELVTAGELRCGTSLCRLGFPFHQVAARFDEPSERFVLAPGTLPVSRFPNEGILSRFVEVDGYVGSTKLRFIETSSPGLRGQSGGPVFDVRGRIWGIQSHTRHYDLGFDAQTERDGQRVIEHQFLNAGLALAADSVGAILTELGVKFESAES
jgi:hypothetical protein